MGLNFKQPIICLSDPKVHVDNLLKPHYSNKDEENLKSYLLLLWIKFSPRGVFMPTPAVKPVLNIVTLVEDFGVIVSA